MELAELEKAIGINFKDSSLLAKAMVHRSYLNEQADSELESNERLEFLGDAVLELLTSEELYRAYPERPEGDLTNFRAAIVCTPSLALEAKKLHLGDFLQLSKGEEESGGREREFILANTFEALLGAIYLDQDLETCRTFLKESLFYKIAETVADEKYRDAKSTFQELTQEEISVTPNYKVLEEWGPDHAKNFRMGVFLGEHLYGTGEGMSKQDGEQAAAANALEKWSTRNQK